MEHEFKFASHDEARRWLLSWTGFVAVGMFRNVTAKDKPKIRSAKLWATEARDAEMLELINAIPVEAYRTPGMEDE
jgi:hypothetical protein